MSAAVLTLQRAAREQIAEVCDRAFEDTFRNDPTVYIVRRAVCRVAVLARHADPESRLAEQWGARLCASVVRVIAKDDTGDVVVRFDNQAAFVSNFLSDYIAGTAWDRWYHGAFKSYRLFPAEQLIMTVLEKNREHLGDILLRLRKANTLDSVLAALGAAGQRKLWLQVVRGQCEAPSEEAFRLFIHAAFRLADSLSLWAGARPSESAFARSYLRASPTIPDWANTSSLASAVVSVLSALTLNGHLSQRHLDSEQLATLDKTLCSSFDWLDKQQLKNSVLTLIAESATSAGTTSLTLRPYLLTPTQKHLLESLATLAREGRFTLDSSDSTTHANLVRLLAAMTQTDFAAQTSVLPILESIVETWQFLRSSTTFSNYLQNLRRKEFGAVLAFASGAQTELRSHLQVVARCGEPALALLEALVTSSPDETLAQPLESFDSTSAGLFLLVRAVQDLRVSTILKDSGFDALEPLLAALAIRIAGPQALQENGLDPGAALWAGTIPQELSSHLERLESLDVGQFRIALLDLLHAQRLIDPQVPAIFPEEFPGGLLSASMSAHIDFVAASLLRSWARWLPGLSSSSVPFLLDKFIRRPGRLFLYKERIDLQLAPGPLDSVLKMACYFADSPNVLWMGNRFLRFRVSP